MKSRIVHGFDVFSEDGDAKLTKRSKRVLKRISEKGYAIVEFDDGPEDDLTRKQLDKIADDCGLFHAGQRDNHIKVYTYWEKGDSVE